MGISKGIAAMVALCLALQSGRALASSQDELGEFQLAMNAYDTGEYETAEKRFRALLDREPPLQNKALAFEVHKYLGATLMFLGRVAEAEKEFEALLREDPEYEPDPVLFPTEVLDVFFRVKLRLADELLAIQKAKLDAEAKAKAEKAALKQAVIEKIANAAHPVYLETKRRMLGVALIPFGVGQFQNGQKLKGGLFMAGEGAMLATNITLWAISEAFITLSRKAKPGERSAYYNSAVNYKLATNIVAGVLIAVVVAGIIDAVVYWVKLGKKNPAIRQMDESEVPEGLRVEPPDFSDEEIEVLMGKCTVPNPQSGVFKW